MAVKSATKPTISRRVAKLISIGSSFLPAVGLLDFREAPMIMSTCLNKPQKGCAGVLQV
nr:MAG TPA: hypothetical protein [Caudoviricetes sp.]